MWFSKKQKSAHYIVGLGNPGAEYELTRHNAGWLFLDFLYSQYNGDAWQDNKKILSRTADITIAGKKVVLVKPQTFMNKSGDAVQQLCAFYKITPQDITVVHDDVDLALGSYKHTTNSGSAGHNGVKSIFQKLSTENIARIRLGIGKSDTIPTDAFVLQQFTDQELQTLRNAFPSIQNEQFANIAEH